MGLLKASNLELEFVALDQLVLERLNPIEQPLILVCGLGLLLQQRSVRRSDAMMRKKKGGKRRKTLKDSATVGF